MADVRSIDRVCARCGRQFRGAEVDGSRCPNPACAAPPPVPTGREDGPPARRRSAARVVWGLSLLAAGVSVAVPVLIVAGFWAAVQVGPIPREAAYVFRLALVGCAVGLVAGLLGLGGAVASAGLYWVGRPSMAPVRRRIAAALGQVAILACAGVGVLLNVGVGFLAGFVWALTGLPRC